MKRRAILALAICLSLVLLVGLAMSQPGAGAGAGGQRRAGGGGGGGGGMGGGMGGGGMRGFGGYNEASVKLVLAVTEQQWQQIKPKLDKVRQLTTESRVNATLMGAGRGRGAGGDTAAPAAEPNAPRWVRPSQRAQMTQQELTEGDKAAEALVDLIEKKDSDPKQIQAKVEALRAARQKAQKELVTAQGDLRKALDARQQAIMTLMGYLD
jgi:hypothetical protein